MYQNDNITSVYQNSTLPDALDSSPITPKLAIGLGSLLALGLIFLVMCIIMLIIRKKKSCQAGQAVRFQKTDGGNQVNRINIVDNHEYAEVVTDDVAENDYYGGGRSDEVTEERSPV